MALLSINSVNVVEFVLVQLCASRPRLSETAPFGLFLSFTSSAAASSLVGFSNWL